MANTAENMAYAQHLLTQLDDDQRKVAQQVLGPLCVKAGAGTGKTRAIIYRIAYGIATGTYDPFHVLAVTFTQKAAAEMRERLRGLGVPQVQARTFHAAALSQLRYFWPTAVGGRLPQLMEKKISLITAAATRMGVRTDREILRDLAQEVEWAAVSLIDATTYPREAARAHRNPPAELDMESMAQFLHVYQETKKERHVIDFEDVLTLTCGMLEEREDIAKRVRYQYRYFVVDEYQDVSPLQHHLLSLWVGDRNDICVVGDAAQTIYSFAGATSRYLSSFPVEYPGARTVELVRDYRSTPQIVSLANRIVEQAPSSGGVHLQAQRPRGESVAYYSYADDEDEAENIAQKILQLQHEGNRLSDIAILYRTNAQSQAFEKALSEEGIGYVVRGGERYFERREIRRVMNSLHQLARTLPADTPIETTVKEMARQEGWNEKAPATRGAVKERWDALNALVELAKQRHNASASLKEFVQEIDERAAAQHAPQIDGVTLSSLHAAKGLEWETVFLAGVSEGLLPIAQAETPDAIDEERRLTYVGVTRAQKRLIITYARARARGRRANRKHSRFFRTIWPIEHHKAVSPRPRSSRSQTREFLAQASDEDTQLFEKLRQWRFEVSTGLGRPAYEIMHDNVLRDVVSAKPKTLRQIGALRGIGLKKKIQYGPALLALLRGEDPHQEAQRTITTIKKEHA